MRWLTMYKTVLLLGKYFIFNIQNYFVGFNLSGYRLPFPHGCIFYIPGRNKDLCNKQCDRKSSLHYQIANITPLSDS